MFVDGYRLLSKRQAVNTGKGNKYFVILFLDAENILFFDLSVVMEVNRNHVNKVLINYN